MIMIFCFSAQDAIESSKVSDGLLYRILIFLNINTQSSTLEFLGMLIRKIAHFSVYALLGCLSYMLCRIGYGINEKISLVRAVFISFLYALTDEIHQIFVPGRTGRIFDVMIDTSGALCGAIFCFIICFVILRRKEK